MTAEVEIHNPLGVPAPPAHQLSDHDVCLHCGRLSSRLSQAESAFCCAGCKAAYQFIQNLGLDYYYCLREQMADARSTPAPQVKSTYAYFDDPQFADQFILRNEQSGISEMDLHISSMHCAACVWLLEKLSHVIPGLLELRVNLLRGTARIKFLHHQVLPSVIATSVAALGYPPLPLAQKKSSASPERSDYRLALQLGVAAFCAMNVMLLFIGRHAGYLSGIEIRYAQFFAWTSLVLSIPVVAYSALPFYKTSLAGLRLRRLHIDLPISLAILAGFIASVVNTVLGRAEVYFDTVTALVFLLLCGRWCQRYALRHVAHASELLYALAPLEAHRKSVTGAREEVFAASLEVGEDIYVSTDERFPCDGEVLSGTGFVNNALLTGESSPQEVSVGSPVWAGTKNITHELLVRVKTPLRTSRLGNLLQDVQSASLKESKISRFIDHVSTYFVVIVLVLAIITFGYWYSSGFWLAWDRVIALLVVSCPCALGIVIPVTLSLASAGAARRGILLRSADALEHLSHVSAIHFDKTGTLTLGMLDLRQAMRFTDERTWDDIWGLVMTLEANEQHPAAQALLRAAKEKGSADSKVDLRITRIEGAGVLGLDKQLGTYRLGSPLWLRHEGVIFTADAEECFEAALQQAWMVVGLSRDCQLLALFSFRDAIRPESKEVVSQLDERAIDSCIVSGDLPSIARDVALEIGISVTQVYAGLSPEEKGRIVKADRRATAFVGDGVNDALALKNADIGIGITGGAEVCLHIADIFLTRPDLSLLVTAIDGAKKTMRLIRRHLLISLFYNVSAATLAILGFIGPLAAALVMPVSSISVILSSLACAPFPRSDK